MAVSQTDQVHEEIAMLLAALRRTRDKQLAAARLVDQAALRQAVAKPQLAIKVYRLAGETNADDQAAVERAVAQKGQQAATAAEDKSGSTVKTEPPTASANSDGKLNALTTAIAKLVPEMIEPARWQPSGEGMIRAVGETIVVRQSDEIQYRVGKFINEMLPGSVPATMLVYHPAASLLLPPNAMNWPSDAEPFARESEARLGRVLEAPSALNCVDTPLSDVLTQFAAEHDVQIYIDRKALSDAGVATDTPITRNIHGLSLRTAIKLVLDELDLTYLVHNEVLMITSKTEAENMLITKVYPVFDLVVRPADAPADRPALDFRSLIENIMSNIAFTTWDDVGGPGAVEPFTNSGALVISQTTEAHQEIAEFLKALREVGQEQRIR